MNEINVTHHKCAGKCPEFKGEQCSHCLIQHTDSDFIVGDVVVLSNYMYEDAGLATILKITGAWSIIKWSDDNAESDVRLDFLRHATDQEINAGRRLNPSDSRELESMGDDAHIENHVSPLCIIDKKKQVEPPQTEVAHLNAEVTHLNAVVERQKAEMVVMQVQIDSLTANW